MSEDTKHTVALDVMGSDGGPATIIEGGIEAVRRLGDRLKLVLVGREEEINKALASFADVPPDISVKHAPDEIPMTMTATAGVRMRQSSVIVGLKMVRRHEAEAFVSPGNTGAVMAGSLLTLGRIPGVLRPAITSVFPTSVGKPCVVLDVGANADGKPSHLSQFAVMGSVYSSVAFGVESPRVGLISIGEERSKGNDLIFSARKLLRDSKINFVGNIEGRDILSGAVDVAVTDGFTGNILLKFAESIQPLMVKAVKRQIQTNIFSRFGVMLLLPFMKRMKSTFDYAESGGAPLLGVNGITIICHGASNAKAIANAIMVAHGMAAKKMNQRIQDELTTNHFGKTNESTTESENNRDGIICSSAGDDQR